MKIVKVKSMEDMLMGLYVRYGFEYYNNAYGYFKKDMEQFAGQVIEMNDDNTYGEYVFHDWMFDEIELEEICCGDCENDNTWTCHICENTYDKSVKGCPNSECNEITRKDMMLDVINDYIDDGSQWQLSEYTNDLILQIRKNNVYS